MVEASERTLETRNTNAKIPVRVGILTRGSVHEHSAISYTNVTRAASQHTDRMRADLRSIYLALLKARGNEHVNRPDALRNKRHEILTGDIDILCTMLPYIFRMKRILSR